MTFKFRSKALQMDTLKNKKLFQILAAVLFLMFVIKVSLLFMTGYNYFGGVVTPLVITINSAIYNVLLLIWLFSNVTLTIKHKKYYVYIFTWVMALILGQIPSYNFFTLGALYAMKAANPEQVVADAMNLAEIYPPMTCIGFPARFPCDNPVSYEVLPPSIKAAHPSHVLILNDYVLLEKEGLEGVFRGFVIFYRDKDVWKNGDAALLQEDCNVCWKIRIFDSLYWYYETPAFPIGFSPFQE